jgi:hypothetical protein
MGGFQWMRYWQTIFAWLCPLAATLRANPFFRLACTREDHAAKLMTAVGALQLIDRHGANLQGMENA